jgi:hypothetical protein
MYDPVIGRWGVVDALADDPMQVDKSPYAYGWNNPVNLTDPDGNCPSCVGAFIGAVTDIALQSVEIALDDKKSFSNNFSYKSVAVSALAGATGVGLASKIGKLGTVAKIGVELAHDAAAGALNQYATEGKVDAKLTIVNAVGGKAVGDIAGKVVGKQVAKSPEAKLLKRQADRAERVAAGNPRPARTAAASEATKKANDYVEKRAVAAGTASSGVAGNVASKVVEDDKKRRP